MKRARTDDATMPSEAFRRRLREERATRGVSQRDLVERLARLGQPLNQPAITRIERGERKVSLDEAVAIATALETTVEHLYARRPVLTWEEELVRRAELSADEAWAEEPIRRQEANPIREEDQ